MTFLNIRYNIYVWPCMKLSNYVCQIRDISQNWVIINMFICWIYRMRTRKWNVGQKYAIKMKNTQFLLNLLRLGQNDQLMRWSFWPSLKIIGWKLWIFKKIIAYFLARCHFWVHILYKCIKGKFILNCNVL